MKNRYLILGFSMVLALAMAVPALGGPSNPIASVKKTANKALKNANKAQKSANSAQAAADAAQATATSADSAAGKAQTTANAANTAAGKAQTAANAAQATANTAVTKADAAAAAAKAAQDTANSKAKPGTNFEDGESVKAVGSNAFALAGCPTGETPSGGGFIISGAEANKARVNLSSQYLGAWIVEATNISGLAGSNWSLEAIAVCVD